MMIVLICAARRIDRATEAAPDDSSSLVACRSAPASALKMLGI